MSPNTVSRFAKHVATLGTFLNARDKSFEQITISDYDQFLAWLVHRRELAVSPNVILIRRAALQERPRLSASLRNQIHMAVKSFYRHLVNNDRFEFAVQQKLRVHDGGHTYKPFLEHLNSRRYVRRTDSYLHGNIGAAQRLVTKKRLTSTQVIEVIRKCHLLRDAFLVVLLYNTGIRIGEALGLRHTDIDLDAKVIWVLPRCDNENRARAKGGRVRGTPVHEYVIRMYEDLVTSDEYAPAFESGTPYVFCNVRRGRAGRAMTLTRADKLCRQLIRRTGIAFHWQMFRHSHASEAIAAGYSLLEVAERLGHASPQTTADFYRHLFSAELRKLYLTGPELVQRRLAELRDVDILNKDRRWL
jgi:integrase